MIEGSRADVSFVAGRLVDKFAYHQPLYRQHQRLTDSGLNVSRPWLTQLGPKAIGLLEPIHNAQLDSIRHSHVIAMDETPIKAGRTGCVFRTKLTLIPFERDRPFRPNVTADSD